MQKIVEEKVEIQVTFEEMLGNRILRETIHESAEFVSPICIAKKLAGRVRLILNLKELHEFVKYGHFTIFGIKTIAQENSLY